MERGGEEEEEEEKTIRIVIHSISIKKYKENRKLVIKLYYK